MSSVCLWGLHCLKQFFSCMQIATRAEIVAYLLQRVHLVAGSRQDRGLRAVRSRATKTPLVNTLCTVWCRRPEFLIQSHQVQETLMVRARACVQRRRGSRSTAVCRETVQLSWQLPSVSCCACMLRPKLAIVNCRPQTVPKRIRCLGKGLISTCVCVMVACRYRVSIMLQRYDRGT